MNQTTKDRTLALLREVEGVRRYAYDDATGERVRAPRGNLTIGCGINLERGLDDHEVDLLERHRLEIEWTRFCHEASSVSPPVVCSLLPEDAQVALASMAFSMGADGLMEFRKMLLAVAGKRWDEAARECLDSRWAVQVRARRAHKTADLLRGCGGALRRG